MAVFTLTQAAYDVAKQVADPSVPEETVVKTMYFGHVIVALHRINLTMMTLQELAQSILPASPQTAFERNMISNLGNTIIRAKHFSSLNLSTRVLLRIMTAHMQGSSPNETAIRLQETARSAVGLVASEDVQNAYDFFIEKMRYVLLKEGEAGITQNAVIKRALLAYAAMVQVKLSKMWRFLPLGSVGERSREIFLLTLREPAAQIRQLQETEDPTQTINSFKTYLGTLAQNTLSSFPEQEGEKLDSLLEIALREFPARPH